MAKKLTIVEQFAQVVEFLTEKGADKEMIKFINDRAELTAKKNASRKPTATQKANAELAMTILEFLRDSGEKMTITKMIKAIPECAELTNQKVSAVVRGLITAGEVEKIVEKGISLFSAVNED